MSLFFSAIFFSLVSGPASPCKNIDLRSERGKSEVDYLHGKVARARRKFNVPTPVNAMLTETLLALTNKDLPLDEFTHKPQKLIDRLKS